MSGVVPTVEPELAGQESAEEEPIFQAPNVLRIMWADPQHLAEQLAVWSLARFGPRAEKGGREDEARASWRGPGRARGSVTRSQVRLAVTEGAFIGGPFIVLVPVAFCAALLAQAQMVFELAAVSGRDPRDPMRAADCSSCSGPTARLPRLRRRPQAWRRTRARREKTSRRRSLDMVKRMSYLLGLLAPDPGSVASASPSVGRDRPAPLVGFVLPLVWVPYLAYATRRSALRLAARARDYYADGGAADAGVNVRSGARHASLGGTVGSAGVALLVLPIGAALIALLTGYSPGGGRWLFTGLIFIGVSFIASFLWLSLRWLRRTGRRLSGRPARREQVTGEA